MEISGGCLCKAVRYRITAAPIIARYCWCRDCQFFAAGNATANVCFPSNAVTVEGRLTDYVSKADSGNIMHRRFCSVCGTPMFSSAESRPHLVFVRAGTLDDRELFKPANTIWTSSAPTWACIDEKIPRITHQPPPVG
jgi:hypothetical protein